MKYKIYLASKISGLNLQEVEKEFKEKENFFKKCCWDVINPFEENKKKKRSWFGYMLVDFNLLKKCQYIYFFGNWKDSRGARIEHFISKILGIKIIYEKLIK